MKRPWKLWPSRFKEELNSIAGVTGIGGLVTTAAGMTILVGTIGSIVSGIGIFIASGTVVYAGFKAIPAKRNTAESLIGKNLKVTELLNIHPPVKRLAIIGPENSGKTTLKKNLAFEPHHYQRTQTVTAQVVTIPNSPTMYLAILDGAGEWYNQQFEAAKEADFLCVILDHNYSHTDSSLSTERLNDTKRLLQQVRKILADSHLKRKVWVEILVNKKDLWENASQLEVNDFMQFCNEEKSRWENANLADVVNINHHSNGRTSDIARFMDLLKNSLL